MSNMHHHAARIAALLITVFLAGCSSGPQMDYSQVELVEAGGKITLDGQPLEGAVVSFDAEDGTFSFGKTDSSGHYTLMFDSVKAGVKPGKKTVHISTTRKILGLDDDAEEGGSESPKPKSGAVERVPEKYNKKSELTVDVTPDKTKYDFDLKST